MVATWQLLAVQSVIGRADLPSESLEEADWDQLRWATCSWRKPASTGPYSMRRGFLSRRVISPWQDCKLHTSPAPSGHLCCRYVCVQAHHNSLEWCPMHKQVITLSPSWCGRVFCVFFTNTAPTFSLLPRCVADRCAGSLAEEPHTRGGSRS